MINFFSTQAKAAPKRALADKARAVKTKVVKAEPASRKTNKHGREAVRLMEKLRDFDWDFEAMKRV